ncbi:MAG: DsbA family protein [SAR86 cluster bacterium]|uniref:2-hydroxychromene-2-carboxylate isomerase n=1 Tax=SAR86 cluster bacterium TaxID=2030880 RepID=A0A972VX86_9GAMM|nr:DsbA family protein [SAR86 cluster bacterium]
MADLQVDLFWSFRSPWSYLATPRLRALQEQFEVTVNFRPVYPIAIRTPNFFLSVDPLWPGYLMTDVHRCAEFLNIPFRWPSPDPVKQYQDEQGRRRTAEDQIYIYRLTRLGIVAAEAGRGIEFADEVSSLIWGGTRNWQAGELLAEATDRAGLDLTTMDAIVDAETLRLESVNLANQDAHAQSGHWGVPTCAFEGEPFFGQDRIDVLQWRLRQKGLQSRAASTAP